MKSTLPMAHSSVDAQQLQATNSFPSAQYTVYVNAGLVYESDGGPATYTKHYYAGPLRVASHIGSGNPNQETHPTSGGNLAQGGPAGSTGSSNGLAVLGDLNSLLANYGMSVPPTAPPTDTITMQVLNDPGECDAYYGADVIEKNRCLCDHFPDVALQQGIDCSPYTPIYWYHPDYIGNVEFVSDRTGQPYQHFYYAPFGDPMVSQHVGTGSFNSAFRFNAKEYDEETGNYYYGARYYDPKVSLWMGVDPKAHLRVSLTPYNFVSNNPILRIDPDGQLDGDYYDFDGNYLGNDGIDDNKVYEVSGTAKFNINDFQQGGKYFNNQTAFNENNGNGFSVNYVGDVTGVSMTFTGSANSSNPKQADGQLNVIQSVSNGKDYTRASFSAVGGPWGNGSPENGNYTVDILLDRGPNSGWPNAGMTVDGVGFSLNLNPQFKTGRSELRIHPDGGTKFGTQGCIGLTCGKGGLLDFRGLMQSTLSNQSNIPLNINILNNPNNNGYGRKVKSNGE